MYFEDFEVGMSFTTGRRTVTDNDLDRFIALSGLDNPIFRRPVDPEGSPRLVPAPLQLSVAMGLAQQDGIFDHVVAVTEFDQMRFLHPVHPNDTVSLRVGVTDKRPTSKPDRGVVRLSYELINQRGQVVMSALAVYLMRRRTGVFPQV